MSSTEDPKPPKAFDAAKAAARSGSAPWGKPPPARPPGPASLSSQPRDKRFFIRICGQVLMVLAVALFIYGVLPDESAPDGRELVSAQTMVLIASIPLMLIAGLLLWWGYGKIGEPLVVCVNCHHINKARTVRCAKCDTWIIDDPEFPIQR